MLSFLSSLVDPGQPLSQEAHPQGRQVGVEVTPPPSPSVKESSPELGRDALLEEELREWREAVYDAVKDVRDPEKPCSLEELRVVREELVEVDKGKGGAPGCEYYSARVGFVPTVPHCSLATLIGLCLRTRLERALPPGQFKVDLYIQPGSHQTGEEITKQINDKERVAAAMENPNLRQTVEDCIREED